MPVYAVIQAGKGHYGGQPIWYGDPDNPKPFTISNLSFAANIWIGSNQSVGPGNPNESTPIGPSGFLSFDGTESIYYVVADAANAQVIVYPGVISVFQPANFSGGGGTTPGNITEDPSSPSTVTASNVVSVSVTTAAFSPPANTLLVAIFNVAGTTTVAAVTDSGGHTWTKQVSSQSSVTAYSSIWTAPITTAPGSITVNGKDTSGAAGSAQLTVKVLNGTATSQSGAGKTQTTIAASTNITAALTTTQVGSLVYLGTVEGGGAPTPLANTSTINDFSDGGFTGNDLVTGRAAAITVTPGATTFGWTVGLTANAAWVGLEILHS